MSATRERRRAAARPRRVPDNVLQLIDLAQNNTSSTRIVHWQFWDAATPVLTEFSYMAAQTGLPCRFAVELRPTDPLVDGVTRFECLHYSVELAAALAVGTVVVDLGTGDWRILRPYPNRWPTNWRQPWPGQPGFPGTPEWVAPEDRDGLAANPDRYWLDVWGWPQPSP